MRYAVFAKHLQAWDLESCCRHVAEAGFDGLDLTVRPGGYVEPADVASGLGAAVKLAESHGLAVPLITTGLLSGSDSAAEPTLRAAADAGVEHAKVHYWPCAAPAPLLATIDDARRQLASLVEIARKCGVKLALHNHSGDCVQSSPWVIDRLLSDHDPAHIGAYFDPAHFALEGGLTGWRFAAELLARRVTLLAVKDFRWVDPSAPDFEGSTPQERRWVPVGTGNVLWHPVLQHLSREGFDGWASVHGEYQGRWSFRELTAPEVLQQCVEDRDFLRRIFIAT